MYFSFWFKESRFSQNKSTSIISYAHSYTNLVIMRRKRTHQCCISSVLQLALSILWVQKTYFGEWADYKFDELLSNHVAQILHAVIRHSLVIHINQPQFYSTGSKFISNQPHFNSIQTNKNDDPYTRITTHFYVEI